MFHYNNNNNDNPFEYSGTDDHHINENPNPCFLSSFPSHLLDDDDLLLSHFLHHHHQEHQHIPPSSPPQQNSPPPPPPPVPDTDTTPADDDQAGVRINISAANHHHEEPSGSKNNKATKEAPKKSSATRKSAGVKKPAVEGTTPKRRRTTPASGTTTRKPAGSGAPRRRTGKKDRHSKIYTAHGPRDRRMRLSLQIARKFFDLQDMLGFDKASKTIEWLFTKSKSAIKEITTASMLEKNKMSCGGASTSSTTTTDCIVSMVGMELESRDNYNEAADHHDVNVEDQFGREKSRKGTNKLLGSSSSTSSLQPVITNPAKEKREKARARARERTNEKRLKKEMDQQLEKSLTNPNCNNNNNYNLDKFGSSSNSTPETGDQELSAGCPSAHEFNSSENCNNNNNNNNNNTTDHQHYSLQNQMASVGIMEKLLLVTASRSSSSSGPAAAETPPLDPSIYDHHPDCHQQQQDGSSTGMVSNTAAGLRWPYINSNNDNAFLDHFPGNWVSAGSDGYGEMTSLMMSHHDNIGHDVSQDQNPSPWGTTITTTSGMFLQSQYPDTHFSCNSQDTNSNISLF